MQHQDLDVLDLLLPDAGPARAAFAQRVTTFLRLLADDARGGHVGVRASVDAPRATEELESRGRERLLEALVDLLRHHWAAALGPESFLDPEPAELGHQEAWSRLEEARAEHPDLPPVPAPGEGPLDVATRLLAGGPPLGMDADEHALWSTRLRLAAREGASSGGASSKADAAEVRAGLVAARRDGAPPARVEAWLADAAAALLDRGAVRGALELLEEFTPGLGGRAATLASWCRTLLGRDGEVLFAGATGAVPRPLLELRDALPALLPALAGAPVRGRASGSAETPLRERCAVGASALLWVRYRDTVEVVHTDLAPALRDRAPRHARSRDGAWAVPGEPEHELLLTGRPVLRWRTGTGPLAGAIDAGSWALALAPVPGPDGEVVGWLQLEWAHRLVPSPERLAALGRALAPELAAPTPRIGVTHEPAGLGEHDPVRAFFTALVHGLGTKTRHRRWTAFLVEDGTPVCVAAGGEGLPGDAVGGARALARALATGGVARFDEPASAMALHGDAASGLVVPARLLGTVVALLALESERRRDFRTRDCARFASALSEHALALRLAAFGAWHRRRCGVLLGFAPRAAGLATLAARLVAAGRARAAVAFVGPRGSGRRTLARWLHFESGRAQAPLVEVAADRLAQLDEVSAEAGLLVDGLEALDPGGAARLGDLLQAEGGPRVSVTSLAEPAELVDQGRLDPDLGRRLERLPFRVPPVARRREELLAWIDAVSVRFAQEEGLAPVVLADDARALLWRQPWEGGLPELENLVYRLTLARAGRATDADQVAAALSGYGLELRSRLPSRHPRAADVLAALAVTRRESGRLNKTRAALYLGWDPDTLVARMEDLGLGASDLEGVREWGA